MVKFLTTLELVMENSDAEVFTELCKSNGWEIESMDNDKWGIETTKTFGVEFGFKTPVRYLVTAKLPVSDMIAFLDGLSFTIGIVYDL